MLNIGIQFFGGRGGGGSGGARGGRAGGGGTDVKVTKRSTAQSNPAAAAVGTKLSMGGYTYTKNSSGTWTTYKNGKRYPNRTNADIKRVFT